MRVTLAAVVWPLWSGDPELVGGGGGLAEWDPCVRGVQVAGLLHIPGVAGLPSESAEPAGAVKASPTGPSVASREAVALKVARRRS